MCTCMYMPTCNYGLMLPYMCACMNIFVTIVPVSVHVCVHVNIRDDGRMFLYVYVCKYIFVTMVPWFCT